MNIFKKLLEKIKGRTEIKTKEEKIQTQASQQPQTQHTEETKKIEKTDEEIIAELNMLAPGIFSQAKTPEMKKIIIQVYKKMLEDGVDVRNEKEVENWIKKNQHKIGGDIPKVETYRREKPKIGRNDPCPCGSGKKYKKCCGSNE